MAKPVKAAQQANNNRAEAQQPKSRILKYWIMFKEGDWGTKSDRAGWIINLVVAAFTIFLFFQTKKATQAAIDASTLADSTFKETQREFEIQHRPFIQIVEVYIDSVTEHGIGFSIKNLGDLPAKVTDGFFEIGFDTATTFPKKVFVHPTTAKYNIVIGQDLSVKTGLRVNELEGYTQFIRGQTNMFIRGRFKYVDYTKEDKPFTWIFTVIIRSRPYVNIDYLQNEEKQE